MKTNKDSCSKVIQNFTSHPAKLPRGIIGYIEIPIIQTTPPRYIVQDVNLLIHSVIHTYHPDTTIPIKQKNYTGMNFCTLVIPQSLLEINKREINVKHFIYQYLLSQETFDLETKSKKIFLPYHILQKINNL